MSTTAVAARFSHIRQRLQEASHARIVVFTRRPVQRSSSHSDRTLRALQFAHESGCHVAMLHRFE